MNIALWIVQALLAALFLFAGGMKLVMPIEEMTKQMPLPLPGWFLLFTGVVEVLGAVGLILPWLSAQTAGSDTAGRRRAGDRYDRRDGVHIGGWRCRVGADAAGGGDPLWVRRLRPLAADAAAPARSMQ